LAAAKSPRLRPSVQVPFQKLSHHIPNVAATNQRLRLPQSYPQLRHEAAQAASCCQNTIAGTSSWKEAQT